MSHVRAVIFVNGLLPAPNVARALIRSDDLLLAADGGTRHVLALGLTPHVVIGDLDSLAPRDRQRLERAGARLLPHPADKDETDLELALAYALERDVHAILIVAALGGRLDQTLANLFLLTDPALRGVDVRLDDGVEEAFFVREQALVRGRAGDVVSLLPWGGPAEGVVTEGLRWALHGETLYPHKTRGVSNEMMGAEAHLRLRAGLLLCLHRRT